MFKKLKGFFSSSDEINIAVVKLSGVIGGGGMMKSGLSIDNASPLLEKAFKTKKIKAVFISVNSPGGSPVQSELIFKKIRLLSCKHKLPVFTFVEDVAASGGYFLACSGDEIYASNSSIVGSIGVISAGFGLHEVIKKLGIERRVYTKGESKSILDPFLPEKKSDVEIILDVQNDIYESFVDLVKERREGKIDLTQSNLLFSGTFWSGKKACKLGLIDYINDMDSVAKEKFGEKVKFIMINKNKSWIQRKISGSSFDYEGFSSLLISKAKELLIWGRYGL